MTAQAEGRELSLAGGGGGGGGGDGLLGSTDGLVQTPLLYSQEEPRHQIMRKQGFLNWRLPRGKGRCHQSENYKLSVSLSYAILSQR